MSVQQDLRALTPNDRVELFGFGPGPRSSSLGVGWVLYQDGELILFLSAATQARSFIHVRYVRAVEARPYRHGGGGERP